MSTLPTPAPSFLGKIVILYHDLRFLNALFGLPLAYIGMVLALRAWPTWQQIGWISLAFLGARMWGHTANQLADKNLDAIHPNKRFRSIPAGLISVAEMATVGGVSGALFLFAAYQLNSLAFSIAPFLLVYLVFYAFTKRFTWATHLFMGATTGTAIAGGWVGVSASISWEPAYLWVAAIFWVAGFDLLLATLDYEFDVQQGLHSIVKNWGVPAALRISQGFYATSVLMFAALPFIFDLGLLFYPFWALAALSLTMQHRIFDPYNFDASQKAWAWSTALFSLFLFTGVVLGLFV